jgi:ornithine cyclodeaminase
VRLLSGRDIAAVAGIADLIAPIAEVMASVSAGGATLPLRSIVKLAGGNMFGIMPGAIGAPAVHGAKLLSLYPDNPSQGRSSHAGLMLVFDAVTGLATGCLDAAELTAMRTAAATAVATRALARDDATRLALIGCGEQAHTHLTAMRAVRDISRVCVWGRDGAKAAAFARAHGIDVADDIADAVAGADIVCTVTPAEAPLLRAEMLRPGLHVNAVGASIPSLQEIATEVVPLVRLFTDYRPSLEAQAAEVIDARRRGLIEPGHSIAEIGEVLAGRAPGRISAAEITLYRSLGIAAQDLAAAVFLLDRAEQRGIGSVVDMS